MKNLEVKGKRFRIQKKVESKSRQREREIPGEVQNGVPGPELSSWTPAWMEQDGVFPELGWG